MKVLILAIGTVHNRLVFDQMTGSENDLQVGQTEPTFVVEYDVAGESGNRLSGILDD